VVKEYDKLYINDPDMKLAAKAAEKYETTFRCIVKPQQGQMEEKQVVDVVVIKIIK
jgi:hypothetical protein